MHAESSLAQELQHFPAGDLRPADDKQPVQCCLSKDSECVWIVVVPDLDQIDPMRTADVVHVDATCPLPGEIVFQCDNQVQAPADSIDLFHTTQAELNASNESEAHINTLAASSASSRRFARRCQHRSKRRRSRRTGHPILPSHTLAWRRTR